MPNEFQIAVDCADPHRLADWWAETLGWTVEQPDSDFIRRMIAEGYATEEEAFVRNGGLTWKSGAAIRYPGGQPPGPARRIIFQRVPEPKAAKNRWHLDVSVGPENVADQVKKLIGRGATYLHDGQQGPYTWVTLSDPEGNEFCVS
jgi:hypothetical protein